MPAYGDRALTNDECSSLDTYPAGRGIRLSGSPPAGGERWFQYNIKFTVAVGVSSMFSALFGFLPDKHGVLIPFYWALLLCLGLGR